jgi:hypothetical protein
MLAIAPQSVPTTTSERLKPAGERMTCPLAP